MNFNFTFSGSIKKIICRSFQLSVVIISLTSLTLTESIAQTNIKLGGGAGIMFPVSDFSGSTLDYYNGSSYGLSSGFNINGKAKIILPGFNLAAEIDYSSLSNTGNSEPGQGKVDISQKILSLKVGPELRINLPEFPVTPYIGINLALNSFSGETTFQGVSKVSSASYSVNGETRFGGGFTLGTEVSISSSLSLDFNISYNLMNVSGKNWTDVNPGINQRIDSYLSLNDERDPLYTSSDDKHFVSNARNIQSVLFTVTLLFSL